MVSEIYEIDIEPKWTSTNYSACYGFFAIKKYPENKSVSCMLAIYNVRVEKNSNLWEKLSCSGGKLGFDDEEFKDYVRFKANRDFKKNRLLDAFVSEVSDRQLKN